VFPLALSCPRLARLDGGHGHEPVPDADLDESSDICVVAYSALASYRDLHAIRVLGSMEASLTCGGRVLFIDGLGSIGFGGGASLACHIWPLARVLKASAVVLKARTGDSPGKPDGRSDSHG
jgi:hypothetical protein